MAAVLLATACASTPRAPTTPAPRPEVPVDCAAFDGQLEHLRGTTVRAAGGALNLAGEPAADERIHAAERVACLGHTAAALLRTDCGNATLRGYKWSGGRWEQTAESAVLDDGRPGHCIEGAVRVTAVALTADEARELVVEAEAQSDDGEQVVPRGLRVVRLTADGGLDAYAGRALLGSFDDATGAATQGRWDIVEELPAPRDLYVEQRPLHGGLAGEPIGSEIRRETWSLRDRSLVRVDVARETVRAPAPHSPPRPLPSP